MTQSDLENQAPASSEASKEELQITHEWARRRLELYDRMERAIRDEISYALRSAADIRGDVEKDADAYMRRLQTDRSRLLEEITDLKGRRQHEEEEFNRRRTEQETELAVRLRIQDEELHRKATALETDHQQRRAQLDAELGEQKATTVAEIERVRAEAATSVEMMISRAQARKAELEEEARTLEERVGHIQGMIDNFLNSQIQSLRGSLTGLLPRTAPVTGEGSLASISGTLQSITSARPAPRQTAPDPEVERLARERAEAERAAAIAAQAAEVARAGAARLAAEREASRQAAAEQEAARQAEAAHRAAEAAQAAEAARHAAADESSRQAADVAARAAAQAAADAEAVAVRAAADAESARVASQAAADAEAARAASQAAADAVAARAASQAAADAEAARVASQAAADAEASRAAAQAVADAGAARAAAQAAADAEASHAAAQAAADAEAAHAAAQAAADAEASHAVAEAAVEAVVAPEDVDEAGEEPTEEANGAPAVEGPASGIDPDAILQTTITIQGVPGFSRALHLQRTIQQVPGVADAKANGYERGILTLEVSHQGRVALRGALTRLAGMRLRLVEEAPGSLTFQTEL